ncbi:hypothetical protein ACEPAH_887 [Sanghuangporus vaninii]
MSVSQQELDGVALIIKDSTTNGYAQLSSLAIVLFDYLLTFDDEVALVWQRPSWGIGSILFNRYTGIFSLAFNSASTIHCFLAAYPRKSHILQVYLNNTVSDNHHHYRCFHWVRYQIGGTIGAFWLVDIILALRVYALWRRSQCILIFLCVMFSGNAIVAGLVFQDVTVMHRPDSFAYGCYPQGFPVWTFLLAIPEVLSSGTLLALTLIRTVRTVRMGRRNAPLIMLFIKDGCLCYLCISTILLMKAFAFSSFTITAAVSGLAIAISCVFGSRILLRLRRQLLEQQIDPNIPSVATMQFGVAERTTHTVLDPISYDSGEVELQDTSPGTIHSSNLDSAQDEFAEKKDARASLHVVDAREHQ